MTTGMNRRQYVLTMLAAQSARPETTVRLPQTVRVGVIGLDGHPGEIFNPLPRLPDVEIAALSDSDAQARAKAAKNPRVANARQYAGYHEMLDREKLDVVAVCNSDGERAEAMLAAIARGLPVIAEKPFAIERPDLERVRRAAAQKKVRLGMLLPMRFEPHYQALRQIVREGVVGEIAQIDAQKSYKAGQRPEWMRHRASYGGTIPWIGIHMVDLMRWTSGREFRQTAGFQARVGFPDMGDMENVTASIFRLDNHGTATLRMDYLRPETAPTHGDDRLRLAGMKGVVEYQASTGVTVLAQDRPPAVLRTLPPPGSVFIDFLEGLYLNKSPVVAQDDMFRVNEIVLTAREAAETGRVLAV
jgi:predicted dehydrogenase